MWLRRKTSPREWQGRGSRLGSAAPAFHVPKPPVTVTALSLWLLDKAFAHRDFYPTEKLTSHHHDCYTAYVTSEINTLVLFGFVSFFAVSGSVCERVFPTVPKKGERYVSVTYFEFRPLL